MHADHDKFIAAVIAEPDDDKPRLIFADWLDEHGEPERAEFIRVGCELANHEANEPTGHDRQEVDANWLNWSQRRAALRRRERELLEAGGYPDTTNSSCNRYRWLAEVHQDLHFWHGCDWEFRRGFVSEITCSWDNWLTHAPALLAPAPIGRVNRGTKDKPDWRGDGLVRLTTWPETWYTGYRPDAMMAVLNTEYPGVFFELPRIIQTFGAGGHDGGGWADIGIGKMVIIDDLRMV